MRRIVFARLFFGRDPEVPDTFGFRLRGGVGGVPEGGIDEATRGVFPSWYL